MTCILVNYLITRQTEIDLTKTLNWIILKYHKLTIFFEIFLLFKEAWWTHWN